MNYHARVMELLAQVSDEIGPVADGGIGWFWAPFALLWGAASLLILAYVVFWCWMLFECIRSEPDRFFWIWLMIIAPFPGAIVYGVARFYPALEQRSPGRLSRWTRGKELARLEAAARQIGNPHQFIQWGDALRGVGQWNDAGDAYRRALEKDPANLQALWGAALVAEHDGRWPEVESLTRRILEKDPQYKFGDVSLLCGIALLEQRKTDDARRHLEQHIKRWRHPAGLYRLAELCRDAGDDAAAGDHLRAMLQDLDASPYAIARKHSRWKSRAKQLLKRLKSDARQ